MDRRTVYPSEVVREIDALQAQKNAMVAIARLTSALYGDQAEFVVDMNVVPTSPAGLAVQVQPGQIYQVDETDMSAWSSLVGDPTEIIQQGMLNNTLTFTIAPPPLVNESKWYVLEAQFEQLDANTAILQYFNPINPAIPLSGPLGTGTSQNQDRLGSVLVQLKGGIPAPTGDEVRPTVDSGFLALAFVHINFGQVSLAPTDIIDVRPTIPTIPMILSNGLKSFGITPGFGGNLDASTLGGHQPGDFVLVSNQNLTGVARLAGGDTILGLDTFQSGVHASHYEYDQLVADPSGFPNGSTWFNANDNHLRVQLEANARRILTEADMGSGGIIDAAKLGGLTAAQIMASGNSNVFAETVTVSSSGSQVIFFPFNVNKAVAMTNGITLPAGGGNASAVLAGFSSNQVTVAVSLTPGADITFTVLAFG